MSEHTRPDGPPGPPTHTHADGTECAFDTTRGRWYALTKHDYSPRARPAPCPGWIESLIPRPEREPAARGADTDRAVAACEAAVRLLARWNEGWIGAVRYAEGTDARDGLDDCADELLQALAPYVMPEVETAGVIPFAEPTHNQPQGD